MTNAYRSNEDRLIAGICGGLARQLGWSSARVRLVWVLATVFTAFAGIAVYLALWFLMPKASPGFEPAPLQPWRR